MKMAAYTYFSRRRELQGACQPGFLFSNDTWPTHGDAADFCLIAMRWRCAQDETLHMARPFQKRRRGHAGFASRPRRDASRPAAHFDDARRDDFCHRRPTYSTPSPPFIIMYKMLRRIFVSELYREAEHG